MKYTEFRKAAFRHLKTCECLIAKINSDDCKNSKNEILVNIFYLSGYVIECSLKYVLFSAKRFKNQDVYEHENLDWKHHNIEKLKSIIEQEGVKFSADIPILGTTRKVNGNVVKLFNERNDPRMQIRYSYYNKLLTIDLIKNEYLPTIEKINTKLINKF